MTKEDAENVSVEARVLVWRRSMPWIEQDGEWELERLLLEWAKSGHTVYRDKPGSKLDWWWRCFKSTYKMVILDESFENFYFYGRWSFSSKHTALDDSIEKQSPLEDPMEIVTLITPPFLLSQCISYLYSMHYTCHTYSNFIIWAIGWHCIFFPLGKSGLGTCSQPRWQVLQL